MKILARKETQIPSIKDVNILYLVCMFLFVGIGQLLSQMKLPILNYNNKMLMAAIGQVVFVFLPVLVYLIFNKFDIKKAFRLNKVSFKNVIICIGIMLFAIPIASMINAIVLLILNYFGKMHAQVTFTSDNLFQLLINILVVALMPAIFEEMLFRGVILKGYERLGIVKAIMISSFLFGILHRDIQSLIGTFILGVVIAYIVYRTNSIFAGVIAHFANNAFIVFLTYLASKNQETRVEYDPKILEQFSNMNIEMIIVTLVVFFVIVTIIISIFVGLLFLLKSTTRNIERNIVTTKVEKINYKSYTPLILSFILVLYVFIMQLK